jgi:two-component system, OmpR family, sensor histidine kinase KdpD
MRLRSIGALTPRFTALGYLGALASVACVSILISLIETRVDIANISMLYLIAVLATAIAFGHGPAVLASVASFLAFDYYFVDPRYTLTVADPAEWISLVLFLLIAIVTSQLTAGQRSQAREAQRREREAVVLYDVVRLMGEADLDYALRAVAERLRVELDLAAVIVEVTADGEQTVSARTGDLETAAIASESARGYTQLLSGGPAPSPTRRGSPGAWIRVVPPEHHPDRALAHRAAREGIHVVPVKALDRQIGALRVVRLPNSSAFAPADNRLLSAVAAQLGLTVERRRLRRQATESEILRRSDELKTALLNTVSHNLRTPLASIIAAGTSLRRSDLEWTARERQELGAVIEEEALRLNQIVGNLLDLSRMEAGALRPEKDLYDLGALVDDVLGRLGPLTARHTIGVDIPDDLPPILLDYVEIDQVLTNLVENAVRYIRPGTEIQITAKPRQGEVEVSVADRGPGVPTAAVDHLFEPFYRVDSQGTLPQGTGLGLTVAKGLVEAHGGRIWAENQSGGGAKFTFTLPVASSAATQVTGSPHRQGVEEPRQVGS